MKQLTVTAVGHVDHGKSTLLGRLLFDTGAVPKERVAAVEARCAEMGRGFEFAFLLDALQEEQAQNITIDLCRFHFKSRAHAFVLIDAPGHKEFLKNMVSGAASADGVVLLVDALEGMRDQTRRHAYLLGLLGIRQIVVAVNKMDKAGYSREIFEQNRAEVESHLRELGLPVAATIPIAATTGANVTSMSPELAWYSGPTLLESLERFEPIGRPEHSPARLPVQDIYNDSEHRIAVGRLESGTLRQGETIRFHPSGHEISVQFIHSRAKMGEIRAGTSTAILLPPGLVVERGETAAPPGAGPRVGNRINVSLFWLGRQPLEKGKSYLLQLTTTEAAATVQSIRKVIQTESLAARTGNITSVEHSEVADLILVVERPIPYDLFSEIPNTGRIVLVDDGEVAGGGIIIGGQRTFEPL